jgi:hypothetical protein
MKTKILSVIAAAFSLTACQLSQQAAQTVRGVTEIAATATYQGKLATVAQLQSLSTDLKGYPNTPLSPQDNQLIANIVSELTRKKAASLTGGSAIDALNNAITALSSTQNATPGMLTGINWAAVQDVALGIGDSVNYINQNTSAVTAPTSLNEYRAHNDALVAYYDSESMRLNKALVDQILSGPSS